MGLENDIPTGNTQDIDVDSLMSAIEGSPNSEITMSAPDAQDPAESPPAAQEQPAPSVAEFEFDYNGKQIKVPFTDPKVKTWAQQGYDYAQKMAAFNQERAKWDTERKTYEDKYSPYKTIDEYARQNPEWWNAIQDAYKNKDLSAAQEAALPQWAKEKLEALDQFKSKFEQEQAQVKEKQEDEALGKEIQSIRDQYKDLDWGSADEHGQSLEQRVLKHALENDIKSFKTAFRDYNHENLIKLHEEKAKENLQKELQKRNKLGIIGQSPTSKKGINPAEGVKTKSYDALLAEAKEELGIA